MKRFILIVFVSLFVLSAGAQVKQEVIASAGRDVSLSNISLTWTVGEVIVPNYAAPDNSIYTTQVFQYKIILVEILIQYNDLL